MSQGKECRSRRKQLREPRQPPFNDDASMHLRVKSTSETAERATETMVRLNGLLETPLSNCIWNTISGFAIKT